MPDVDCTLRCYLRPAPQVGALDAAQRLQGQLVTQGYHIVAMEEQDVDIAWYRAFFLSEDAAGKPDPTARFAFAPGISAIMRHSVEDFAAQQRDYLGFFAYSTSATHGLDETVRGLSVGFEIDLDEGILNIVTHSGQFSGGSSAAALQHYLHRLTYRVWRPLFACALYGPPGELRVSREEVLSWHLPYLYRDHNFLGPELVDTLGREQVLSTPGATIEELEDGGVYLQPWDEEKVNRHLGLRLEGFTL
jgi:hypothetical protein